VQVNGGGNDQNSPGIEVESLINIFLLFITNILGQSRYSVHYRNVFPDAEHLL